MDKLFLLVVIAILILGPDRVPYYAHQLGLLVKRLKSFVGEAKERVVEELGPEYDVDWKKLDPRQYDPRRIVREALLEDDTVSGLQADLGELVERPTDVPGVSLGGTASRPGAGNKR